MSTKNLARTVIECGREPGMTRRCRYKNGTLRVTTRSVLARLDVSDADPDAWVVPRPPKVGRWSRDKLRPAERWLRSQIGRPWNLVRSDLLSKFDTRTIAGRHIIFDHILGWVKGESRWCGGELFDVDAHGLLRRLPRRRFHTAAQAQLRAPLPRPARELVAWLSGRRVGGRGACLFWFIPTARGGYRQQRLLDHDDAALWRTLPAWFRACHDPFAS